MKIIKTIAASSLAAFSFMAAMAVIATPANAQATRTWVSGVGDDANPCSRTAPCKTFAGAISKTATNGEINCLDPGGFGAVTITKSITIDCEDTQGSILASGTSGVIVNGANVNVILRGISINGVATTAGSGIRFLQGASLTVDEVFIQNFAGSGVAGNGIQFNPTGAGRLTVTESSMVNNSIGIMIQPGPAGSIKANIEDSHVVGNSTGVRVDTTGSTGAGAIAMVSNALISGGTSGLIVSQPVGAAAINVMVAESTISNNASFGINASGASVRVRVGGSTVTNSGTAALAAGGAVVNSYGDNQLDGNSVSDGTFAPLPLQ